MSHRTERSLDEIAQELDDTGEVTMSFDVGEGAEALEGAAGFLTALAEFEDFETPPGEVEITIRE